MAVNGNVPCHCSHCIWMWMALSHVTSHYMAVNGTVPCHFILYGCEWHCPMSLHTIWLWMALSNVIVHNIYVCEWHCPMSLFTLYGSEWHCPMSLFTLYVCEWHCTMSLCTLYGCEWHCPMSLFTLYMSVNGTVQCHCSHYIWLWMALSYVIVHTIWLWMPLSLFTLYMAVNATVPCHCSHCIWLWMGNQSMSLCHRTDDIRHVFLYITNYMCKWKAVIRVCCANPQAKRQVEIMTIKHACVNMLWVLRFSVIFNTFKLKRVIMWKWLSGWNHYISYRHEEPYSTLKCHIYWY